MKRTNTSPLVFYGLLASGLVTFAAAGVAHAFPEPRYWHMAASGRAGVNRAGAEGNYFTGGAQDHGLHCATCHIEPAALIGANITAVPAFGTSTDGDFRITAATSYRITIAMTGEHLHFTNPMGVLADHNGMNATIEDDGGARAGRFRSDSGQDSNACPAAEPTTGLMSTILYGDCHGVLGLGPLARTSWTFTWDSPATLGSGLLHLWVSMVDGDAPDVSSLHDDSFVHEYLLSPR